jgi:hypothetical protein
MFSAGEIIIPSFVEISKIAVKNTTAFSMVSSK